MSEGEGTRRREDYSNPEARSKNQKTAITSSCCLEVKSARNAYTLSPTPVPSIPSSANLRKQEYEVRLLSMHIHFQLQLESYRIYFCFVFRSGAESHLSHVDSTRTQLSVLTGIIVLAVDQIK
jgi:hypothetical protein